MADSRSGVFLAFAEQVSPEVDVALDRYTQSRDGLPETLRDAIRHSLLAPGKRLRPLLVLMAAEACGHDRSQAMPAACAVEMVHAYSLIHDDLPAMDDDDMRRGRPSCHAKYGESTAILAGDALLAKAFEVLSDGLGDPEIGVRCIRTLATAAGDAALVGGQYDDLAPESHQGGLAMLERIHARKTGALIRASLAMGGVVARATDLQLRALEEYGQKLGLAFQVVDDLLDRYGNQEELGKRTNKDSDKGKLTYPGLLGEQASREKADALVQEALTAVASFGERAGELESLAHYVVERTH